MGTGSGGGKMVGLRFGIEMESWIGERKSWLDDVERFWMFGCLDTGLTGGGTAGGNAAGALGRCWLKRCREVSRQGNNYGCR